MRTEYLRSFREEYLKDVKTTIFTVSLILAVAFGVILFAALELVKINPFLDTLIKVAAVFLFTVGLIVLNRRSLFAARLFKRLRLNFLFPAIDRMIEDQEKYRANLDVVQGMARAIDFYALWADLGVEKRAFEQSVYEDMSLYETDDQRIQACAHEVNKRHRPGTVCPSVDLLELLYRERQGEAIKPYDQETETRLKRELAAVLRRSGRLPAGLVQPPTGESEDAPFYYQGDLEGLLHPLHHYTFYSFHEKLATLRKDNQLVVERMKDALAFYKVRQLTEHEVWLLANSIPAGNSEDDRIRQCAGNISRHLAWPSGNPSAGLLELLYRERTDPPVTRDWKQTVDELAEVLIASGHLPGWHDAATDSPVRNATCLAGILSNMREFCLDGVVEEVVNYQANARVVDNMVQALAFYRLLQYLPAHEERDRHGQGENNNPQADVAGQVLATLADARTEERRIECCAMGFAQVYERTKRPFSKDVLAMLYRERFTPGRLVVENGLVPELAQILYDSKRLPEQARDLPRYKARHIRDLLRHLPEFTLSGVVDALADFQGRRRNNLAVVMGMERVLNFYRLFPELKPTVYYRCTTGRDCFRSTSRDRLTNQLPDVESSDQRLRNNAELVAGYRRKTPSPVSADLLELLYRERHEMELDDFWVDVKQQVSPDLATILYQDAQEDNRQGLLPRPDASFPYCRMDLERLLLPLKTYSPGLLRRDLDAFGRLWRLAGEYQAYLIENGIEGWEISLDALFEYLNGRTPKLPVDEASLVIFDEAALDVLLWVSGKAIGTADKSLSPSLLNSFCLIAIAIFLSKFERQSPEMLAAVCKRTSEIGEAVEIALAFVDFRADLDSVTELGGKPFVSVRYLMDNWVQRIAEKRENLAGFNKELRTIQATLAEGQWFTRLWRVLEQTWRDLRKENRDLEDLVKEKDAAREALRGVFKRKVKVPTLERFLEARTVNAYLLSFDSTKGSLAGLIDCLLLRCREEDFLPVGKVLTDEEKLQRAQFYKLRDKGIDLWDEQTEQWIYTFARYTFNSRIGIVPHGWKLSEFQKRLERDLKILANKTDLPEKKILAPDKSWRFELESTEVIVHRFGLRNHFTIELKSQSETAIQNMLTMFAYRLEDGELVSTAGYQLQDTVMIAEAMLEGTIIEMTADDFDYADEAERNALVLHDERIRETLLEGLACSSFNELGRLIVKTPARVEEGIGALTGLLLETVKPLKGKEQRATAIAGAYFETMVSIAQLL